VDASLWNFLGQFASVFAAVAAAVPFVAAMQSWYKSGIGSRRDLKRRLTQMIVGVTSDHVRSLFGVPIMLQLAPGVEGPTDYVFMTNHAWIVARIRDGAVEEWSVTVTDRKFKFDLRDLTRGLVEGTLGHSTFADVVKKPNGVYEERGAATYSYTEGRYFGRPSAYQTFVFMYNQEGIGPFVESGQRIVASGVFAEGSNNPEGDVEQLEVTRQGTVVNTFYACGPSNATLSGGAAMWPVVHRDRVAPLRGAPAERKKWLKKRTTRGQRFRNMLSAAQNFLEKAKRR
jgi:hypothetical protein